MGLQTIITTFRDVATSYTSVNHFIYGKPFDMNGAANINTPAILVDAMPDWNTSGTKTNMKVNRKEYLFKVFAYDRYTITDKKASAGKLEVKQEEVEIILDQYLAEVARRLKLVPGHFLKIEPESGFHGWYESHNIKMVQCFQRVRVLSSLDCETGTFV